jgi:RNA polymerase sigma factor (TIGR02999 family)
MSAFARFSDAADNGRMSDTSHLLARLADGDEAAANTLMPLVYKELRGLAQRLMGDGGEPATLEPTALVHEAYLKLLGAADPGWNGRTHFRAIAAKAMRQVLIDHARGRNRAKRGGGWQRVTLSHVDAWPDEPSIDVDALESALVRLQEQDERAATVVVLRFFGGMEERAIAEVLGVSERTVRNDWRMARAWLRCEMDG